MKNNRFYGILLRSSSLSTFCRVERYINRLQIIHSTAGFVLTMELTEKGYYLYGNTSGIHGIELIEYRIS